MVLKEANVDELYEKYKEINREHVKSLQEWLLKQPHLPKFKETYLMQFLFCTNYNNEKAKVMIENFSTMWTHFPELCGKRNPRSIEPIFSIVSYVLFPEMTSDNCNIIYMRTLKSDPTNYVYEHALQYMDMFISLNKETMGVSPGQILVLDASNYNLSFLPKFNIVATRKFLRYIQEGLPVVIKDVHLINITLAVEKLFLMFKPFIRSDLFKTIHFWSKMDEFRDYMSKECLPIDYGGSKYSLDKLHDEQVETMLENSDFFQNENFFVDESKRPGKPMNANEIFGMEGTFKKLSID